MKSKISFAATIFTFAMALCFVGSHTAMAAVTSITVGSASYPGITGDVSGNQWNLDYNSSILFLEDGFDDSLIKIEADDNVEIKLKGFCVATKIIFEAKPNNTLLIGSVSSVTKPGFLTVKDGDGIKSSGGLKIDDPANVTTRKIDVSSNVIVNTEGVVKIENSIPNSKIQHYRGILFNGSTGSVQLFCKLQAEFTIGNGETLTTLSDSVLDLNNNKITIYSGGVLDNETNSGTIRGPGKIVLHSGGVLKKGKVDESAGAVKEESGNNPPPSAPSEFSGGCATGAFGIAGFLAALAVSRRR